MFTFAFFKRIVSTQRYQLRLHELTCTKNVLTQLVSISSINEKCVVQDWMSKYKFV